MVKTIGVLGLQGSFKEHLAAIERLGSEVVGVDVRTPEALATVDALIIPGGESTAIAVGLEDSALLEPVRAFCASKPVWGICAGLILLADTHVTRAMSRRRKMRPLPETGTMAGDIREAAERYDASMPSLV